MSERHWPLGHRDAHEAAVAISEPLADWPIDQRRKFVSMLSGRLISARDKADMMERLRAVQAEFRELLPEEPAP